jgi:hypothetical protein
MTETVIHKMTVNLRVNFSQFYFLRLFVVVILIASGSGSALAQLRQFPLPQVPVKKNLSPAGKATARKKTTSLTLPFWDDFSDPDGAHPDTLLWSECDRIFVNNGLGINQPSLGVSTFDGLDSVGMAYNSQQVLVTGFNDNLTSQPIDLSESQVSLAERTTVYLSFFFQWQGNGEAPDPDDYLQLQFLQKDSVWQEVMQLHPKRNFDATVFYDTIFSISDSIFFYNKFQFRFRNFGRQSGPYDTWNVDYVYLNKNRTSTDHAFPDRAIASSVSPLFGTYRSLPYRHYKYKKSIDAAQFDIQNLSDSTTAVNYTVDGTFINYLSENKTAFRKTYSKILLDSVPISESGVMQPFERVRVNYNRSLPDINDTAQFHPRADSVDIKLKFSALKDIPGVYRINDTITSTNYLRDFYAYDDGVAEYAAGLIQPGNLLAYQFDMLLSDSVLADTLNGIQFYFPSYGVSANQTLTFVIYHDDNGKPGKVWQTYPPRVILQKGPNQFQHLSFIPALLINEPKFYIGWKQPSIGTALVGLDIDNDTGDRIFVNTTNSEWFVNDVVKGSLMIRPVFGKGNLEEEVNVGVTEPVSFSIYPNPANGNFYVKGAYDQLKIYSITGNEVSFESDRSADVTQIQLHKPASGLYLLRITQGNKVRTHKLVISR